MQLFLTWMDMQLYIYITAEYICVCEKYINILHPFTWTSSVIQTASFDSRDGVIHFRFAFSTEKMTTLKTYMTTLIKIMATLIKNMATLTKNIATLTKNMATLTRIWQHWQRIWQHWQRIWQYWLTRNMAILSTNMTTLTMARERAVLRVRCS